MAISFDTEKIVIDRFIDTKSLMVAIDAKLKTGKTWSALCTSDVFFTALRTGATWTIWFWTCHLARAIFTWLCLRFASALDSAMISGFTLGRRFAIHAWYIKWIIIHLYNSMYRSHICTYIYMCVCVGGQPLFRRAFITCPILSHVQF